MSQDSRFLWVVYTLAKVKITTSNHKEIWTLKSKKYGKKPSKIDAPNNDSIVVKYLNLDELQN